MTVEGGRIGILGGSFDPVHNGHLALARQARSALHLDQVWFMPAFQSPNKAVGAAAGPKDRKAMVELALQQETGLVVSDLELKRGGPSFTVETLERLHQLRPQTEWFWILGADAFLEFPEWKRARRILELAHLVVAARPGCGWGPAERILEQLGQEEPPPYRPAEDRPGGPRAFFRPDGGPGIYFLDLPPHDIASSYIRQEFGGDPAVKKMLPHAVVQYIIEHHLYV